MSDLYGADRMNMPLKRAFSLLFLALAATGTALAQEPQSTEPCDEAIQRAREIAEDMRLYGMTVRRLPYTQVKEILLSDKIYEGGLPKEMFRINGIYSELHPYCVEALAQRVAHSTASKDQKNELWALLFYRKFSVVDMLTDDFRRVQKIFAYTPRALWGNLIEPTQAQILKRTLKPWIMSLGLSAAGATAYAKIGALKDAMDEKPLSKALATTIPIILFLYLQGKAFQERSFEQAQNLFIIKTLEACVDRIFLINNAYKDLLPQDLRAMIDSFNNTDIQLRNYSHYGQLDLTLFKNYHMSVCEFYDALGKKAGLAS